MGSIYGVAWPGNATFGRNAGSNQTCPAGSETIIMTWSGIQASAPGFYYPLIFGNMAITLGATPPTALSVSYHINGGSSYGTLPLWTNLLVANANLWYPFFSVGATSAVAYYPGPGTFTIGLNPVGQSVTYTDAPTSVRLFLMRGPDS